MATVDVAAFTLPVWTEGTAFTHAFVDFDSKPCKCFVYVVFSSGHKTLRVGIFDSQNHCATVLPCKKIVIKRRAYAAYMKRTRGRRCETHSNGTVYVAHRR